MYNILLPAFVLLIAAFCQSNARVLSAPSPLINRSPDTLAESDWSSDPESIFIAKDSEGCLNPVSSSKSKRENTNSLYDFSQFFDKTDPGAGSNSELNPLSPSLFDKTNIGANSNSDVNYVSPSLANDATTQEGNTATTDGSIDSAFLNFGSDGTSPVGGHSFDGSSVASSSSNPGSPSNVGSDVQPDTADIAEYVPSIICFI